MSKASIDRLLNIGGRLYARQAGNVCPQYRPVNYLNPLDVSNKIADLPAAFILNGKFNDTLDWKFQVFDVKADTSGIEPGDIFVDTNGTYVVVATREAEACKAILANEFYTVNRPVYSTVGGYHGVPTPIAVALPANKTSTKGIPEPQMNPGKQIIKPKTLVEYEIRMFFRDHLLKIGDQLVDSNGAKSIITSIEFSALGYIVTAAQV